jgi:protein-S-isoprenylcysteine O-methyltransferase Ste14
MSRFAVAGVFAVLAAASTIAAVDAAGDAFSVPSAHTWSVAGFVLLRTAVLFAVSLCVCIRKPPERHARAPIAFAACAAALVTTPLLEKPAESAQTWLLVSGEAIALVAWAWLLVSFVTLGRCFGILPEARGLVTRGPYGIVRHPVYLGELVAFGGLVIASPSPRNGVLALVFAAAQTIRMRLEEQALAERFPEYHDYASATPRLLPLPRLASVGRRGATVAGAAVAAALLLAPIGATASKASLATPAVNAPAAGARTEGVPWFGWSAVSGAAQYEFQIAADPGMNAPVLGQGQDRFFTKNTRATLKRSLPDRTYWWRVRASRANGDVSAWTAPRAFTKVLPAPRPQTPVGGAVVSYPGTPLKLVWNPVDRAVKYLVTIASDPSLGSVIGGKPVETFANAFTRTGALSPGTYYWGVTPVDAQGNPGTPSQVSSFVWAWPSRTAVRVNDLSPDAEVVDPQFGWDPIPGAARYELEVSTSQDYAPGSKVCCSGSTIGTVYSPTNVLKDNRYYWRVRGIDVDGNPGDWNEGPVFDKRFDKVPPVASTSIKNLRIRDNVSDPGTDLEPGSPGSYETRVPLLAWDPVPGASSYEVEVTPMGPSDCNWTSTTSHWRVSIAVNAWSPLGSGWNGQKPYADLMTVATDFQALSAGTTYCARVRARSNRDSAGTDVYGDYTYIVNGGTSTLPGPSFKWLGFPSGASCSPSCNSGYLGAGDYVTPSTGTLSPRTPYFTWRPLAGKQSYFVLVAKDAQFSNIVDYAFTQLPIYAPRSLFRPTTYPDETTSYYWVVLPANGLNGDQAAGVPLLAAPQSFEKRSTPPAALEPAPGANLLGHPTFRWSGVEGARRYRLQVSQDDRFGTLLEDVVTDSTAYTSNTTYPADTVLYWRVRADDENLIGLTWSDPRTFAKRLEAPVPSASNATRGDYIPTWTWSDVRGAVSYDMHVDLPDGRQADLTGQRTPALTPVLMYGTGVFRWKVRANFPRQPFGTVAGPYSGTQVFTRTIAEPTGVRSDNSKQYPLLLWDPKPGPKQYRVQISMRADFATAVEDVITDNTSYAPQLTHPAFAMGVPLYWHVAAMDEGRNTGDWSPVQRIGNVRKLSLRARGAPKRKRMRKIVVTVRGAGKPIAGATVRLSGAGARRASVRTNRKGSATFKVRATKRGMIVFAATKSGYASATLRLRVR